MVGTMTEEASNSKIVNQPHHDRSNLCTTRLKYRQGRKYTAVKVYTVNDESRHLLIHGVPSISLAQELKNLCERYGSVEHVESQPNYPRTEFTEVYYVRFHRIQAARFAKKKLDDLEFYGGILHVCYAPELETVEDTKQKLENRENEVLKRLNPRPSAVHLSPARHVSPIPSETDASPSVEPVNAPSVSGETGVKRKNDLQQGKASQCGSNDAQPSPVPRKQVHLTPRQAPVKRIVYLSKNSAT